MENPNGAAGANSASEDAARRIKDSATSALQQTRDVAQQKLQEGTQRLAGQVQSAASALHRAAGDVEQENSWIGMALHKTAEGLEGATRSLQEGDVRTLVTEINGFARRQPALFLGGALALGFILARVGKTAFEASPEALAAGGATEGREAAYPVRTGEA